MASPGTPTYDQLRVFLCVVETGSFAGAGRRLNRATSVVSYTIANLELQLGVSLFERQGTKKPRLTEAGQAVLADARAIAHGMDGLRARVKGLSEGLEAELHLAVDVMLPGRRLACILKEFQDAFPTVTLRLHAEALGAVTSLVLGGQAMIGVSGPLAAQIDGLERTGAGSVPLVPVAAPGHPLARAGAVAPGEGREHLQLVLTDRSALTQGQDFEVLSPRTWRLADLGSKHVLLLEGIGWGNMPLPMVEADLAAGRLVRLALPDHRAGNYPFDAIHRSDSPPGPAGRWTIRRFAEG